MGMLGWETPEPEDPELEMDGEMPMVAPDVPEAPIHLPDAPKYQVSFTHPNKIQPGFTADFAPVVPETITIEDSDGYSDDDYDENDDEDTKRRKAKGKGKARRPPSPAKTAPVATLICPVCRDPLRMGGTNENERLYTLRCGHVLDGKCLWRIAKPDDGKGAKSQVEEEKTGVDPRFEFTFAAQPQPSTSNSRDDDDDDDEDDGDFSVGGVYQEVNHPMPVVSRSRLRSGREIVPTPNPGRRRRGGPRLPGRSAARGGLDDVDDQPAEDAPPRLDLTDPFLPVLVNPPTFAVRAKGKLRRRKVPKTRGKLQEQIFEWTCPVEGCGHGHISVRLDVSGAPWKPDEEKGAIAMFL
ncbi:hypothetical protein FRC18_005958 [Serendipita sp. 400]|nr:hypothetical protein FRC18_005958 [Serendipita sp. 400]